MFISKLISKVIGDKQEWRAYKARARALPTSYRTALEALERYLMYFGGGGDGTAIFADLVDRLPTLHRLHARRARASRLSGSPLALHAPRARMVSLVVENGGRRSR